MTLTPENMQTKNGVWRNETIDADILQMDTEQLENWFAATVFGQYFKRYENIAFFPDNLRVHQIDVIGRTLAYLYSDPNSEDPRFRERLSTVLLHILQDAADGTDVLQRFGHSPQHPMSKDEKDTKRYSDMLVEASIGTVSHILYSDGEQSLGKQFESTLEQLSIEGDGRTTVDEIADAIEENEELIINPEHVELLRVVARLGGSHFLGGIIESYLEMLPEEE